MSRVRIVMTALLACAAMLASLGARAQPHTPPQVDFVATPTADADVWLRRLVGRFRFEGMVSVVARGDCPVLCEDIKGTSDCVAVGTGPGVQCILDVHWQDMYEVIFMSDDPGEPTGVFEVPGGVPYLDPAMELYGLNPGSFRINHLLVNNKGLPEGGLGAINGNRATFKTPCVNAPILFNAMKPQRLAPYRTCERIVRIDAKPDAKLVFMTIDIEINEEPFTRFTLSLRQEPRDEDSGAPAGSAALR